MKENHPLTHVISPCKLDERELLEREQQKLSWKQYRSNNNEEQRRRVAEYHADPRRKRRDFLHILPNYYARGYDLVAVEDMNVKRIIKLASNSRNTAHCCVADVSLVTRIQM